MKYQIKKNVQNTFFCGRIKPNGLFVKKAWSDFTEQDIKDFVSNRTKVVVSNFLIIKEDDEAKKQETSSNGKESKKPNK